MIQKRESKWERAVRAAGPKGSLPFEKPDWIGRALPRAGVLPPAAAEQAICAGRVKIDAKIVRDPLTLLGAESSVTLDDQVVSLSFTTFVLAYHKPTGCVVSTKSPDLPTVFDLLLAQLTPPLDRYGWHAVGRLDKDTTGLLLLSNNERLVAHGTRPETHLPKRYVAELGAVPNDAQLEKLRHGVLLEDGITRPALAKSRSERIVELTITEGRYHQVKRMFRAVGLRVRSLHREAIGSLTLDVPLGGYRLLTEDEITEKLRLII